MTENDLLSAVLDLCKLRHLLVHHDRPARTEQGWRTAIQGDAGFPDLVIAGPGGVLYRELKTDGGQTTAGQRVWIARLTRAGADVALWRPSDMRSGRIAAELEAVGRG